MTDDILINDHRLSLKGRKELSVSGVSDVDSFDERMIIAETKLGELTIKGEGLKILSLNTEMGEMSVEGSNISSLAYTGERTENTGFFKRIFK